MRNRELKDIADECGLTEEEAKEIVEATRADKMLVAQIVTDAMEEGIDIGSLYATTLFFIQTSEGDASAITHAITGLRTVLAFANPNPVVDELRAAVDNLLGGKVTENRTIN